MASRITTTITTTETMTGMHDACVLQMPLRCAEEEDVALEVELLVMLEDGEEDVPDSGDEDEDGGGEDDSPDVAVDDGAVCCVEEAPVRTSDDAADETMVAIAADGTGDRYIETNGEITISMLILNKHRSWCKKRPYDHLNG